MAVVTGEAGVLSVKTKMRTDQERKGAVSTTRGKFSYESFSDTPHPPGVSSMIVYPFLLDESKLWTHRTDKRESVKVSR